MFQFIAINTARRIVLETIKTRHAFAANSVDEPTQRALQLQVSDLEPTDDEIVETSTLDAVNIAHVLEEIYEETDFMLASGEVRPCFDQDPTGNEDDETSTMAAAKVPANVLAEIYEETDRILAFGEPELDTEFAHMEELEVGIQAGESKAYFTEKDILEDILNEEIIGNGTLVINKNRDSATSGTTPYSVSMVGPITDYQARGQELEDLNFMEFCLLINKCDCVVQKEMGAAAVVDGIDDVDVDDDGSSDSSCEASTIMFKINPSLVADQHLIVGFLFNIVMKRCWCIRNWARRNL